MMTIEEAAEIILQNEPYINCINCDGIGWHSMGLRDSVICSSCHGRRVQVVLEYQIACNVLGLEVP